MKVIVAPDKFKGSLTSFEVCAAISRGLKRTNKKIVISEFPMADGGDGCNVQENCTIHMFPGVTVLLKEYSHIGHGAIVHGANIGKNCLVGMNSVIMDDVELGDECIVGALTFINEGEIIPSRSIVAGNPGKIIKQVTDEMIAWKTKGTELYQLLSKEMAEHVQQVEPLREAPANQAPQHYDYKTWKKNRQ